MLGFLFGGLIKKIERIAINVPQDLRKEVDRLFDDKLIPLADKLDYSIKNRITESKYEVEELETKVKDDIEKLLDNAEIKTKVNIERINQLRENTIDGLRRTIGQTDNYIENRVNQISLVVMETLASTEGLTNKVLLEISNLENKLFKDTEQLIDKLISERKEIDESTDKKIERVIQEFKKYLTHFFPNPFDKCKQKLNIQWKYGGKISDVELYKLSNCYELSKLNGKTPINEVIEIYGQLQLNAARMAVLVRESPELKKELFKIGLNTVCFVISGLI